MAKSSRRRSRDAWGSITETAKGVWRIRYWAETNDGYRRCSKTVRGTRRQAEEVRSRLMIDHSQDKPCPTVGQAWDLWGLPGYEKLVARGDLSKRTFDVYTSVYKKHVLTRWGDTPCDKVTPLLFQQWLDTLGLNAARKSIIVMKWVFDNATRFGFISTNPIRERYILPSKDTVSSRDHDVWDEGELGEIWRACHGTYYEASVLLQAFGSCRVAESLSPSGGDVTMYEHAGIPCAAVWIEFQVGNEGTIYRRTKTKESRRFVIVPGSPGRRLGEIAKEHGSKPLTEDGGGWYVPMRRVRDSFKADLSDAGIEAHDMMALRRSWRTIMRRRMKLPEWVAEPLMGHKLQDVTSRHYDVPDVEDFVREVCEAYARYPYSEYEWLTNV